MSMEALIAKFRTLGQDRVERMNALLVSLERERDDKEGVEELLREIHTLKGEAKMMGFGEVNQAAHHTETVLMEICGPEGLLEPGPLELVFAGMDLIAELLEGGEGRGLESFAARVEAFGAGESWKESGAEESGHGEPLENESVDGEGNALKIQASNAVRVEVEKLERLGEVAGETLLMSRRLDYRLRDLGEVRQELRDLFKLVETNLPKSRSMALRHLIHRIDACETALREENHLVNARASQLDEEARRLRHTPLEEVLSHYPRAIRDLAKAQGKKVRLVHSFGAVEVDRRILGALSEPLLHLVRNAVDHGIETPEERKAAGKKEEGEIALRADYIGDSIRVVLRDDGAGIDGEKIRETAIRRGVLEKEKARRLTDQEAMGLIFEAGFSTREELSDVSGRGIGMNVVREQISRVGGFIEIESVVGEGTTFTVHLPVSSAISSVLMVEIGERCFGIAAKEVEEVLRLDRESLSEAHGGISLRRGDRWIPLVDWSEPLGLEPRGELPESLMVVLIRKGPRRAALWVDRIMGEREAMTRPLGEFLSGLRLALGAALTDSGAVVPLLNAAALMEGAGSEWRVLRRQGVEKSPLGVGEKGREKKAKTILVVEDSEVTRSLVSSILRNRGYRVVEADDGRRGLALLDRSGADLVLTDIQMPGMDGLKMLKEIRKSSKHQGLPVVILTTLGGAEDKKKAMGLGANGYLVKLSFQEEELLEMVDRYLG